MKKTLRQGVLWLGSAIIALLAVPAGVLLAMIYAVSALVDRLVEPPFSPPGAGAQP